MRSRFLAAFALLGAATAFGQTWTEVGDAPDLLPGQATGSGTLTTIIGDATNGDHDMYAINITDPLHFVAGVSAAGGTGDSQLFLFDANGMGVVMDDDSPFRRGGTRSVLAGRNGGITAAGLYYLAISSYDRDPVDSAGNEIWLDQPFNTQRTPDGPGAANPIAGWDTGTATSDLTNYTITLRGASAAGGAPQPTPEPATLTALALGGLLLGRRR